MYFDRESGLIVKTRRMGPHVETLEPVPIETFVSDYKTVSGVQFPCRFATYLEGRKIIDVEITSIQFLEKLDDRLFEMPK
jgi:hypothetical protein